MLKEKSIIQICIVAVILLLPLAHLKVIFFGMPLYSVEMPIVAALLIYGYGWYRGEFSPMRKINFCDPFVIGIILFFLGAVISFVANPFSLTGLGMLKMWFVFPLLVLWLWVETKPTARNMDCILLVWLGVIAVSAAVSLAYLFQGVLTYDGRLAAWYASPNYLALSLVPGVLLAHYFYFHSPFPRTRIIRPLICLMLTLLLTALFFTHSYAVWISVALAGLLFLFLDTADIPSWRKKLAAIFLLLIVFGTFVLFELGSEKWQALTQFENRSSFASRMMIWQAAGKIIYDHPILGIGLGRFQTVYLEYQKYFLPYLEWAVPQPHNLYLAVWLQTGLLGLVGFVLLIARSIYILIKNKGRESVLLLGLLVLYLIYGIFDTPFFKTDLAFSFWLVIGLSLALKSETEL
ncbi:MAG: hypothetical protein A3J06_00975 [Candidatus Moranbacteria bacterium RIFCSPLOWO2_02_FULL_48_19]|nr:MAG: hypothetical protein A3J06_00975 [Candidatus Moranbacteria bacterium RIFCSPLOWO2_02_FULL_48_19]OGI31571.1 MAG: hypothetical protein A3G09_04630 [Candidatus Moranbacteria bacterium RIFCSPLOWO2_12_FULL_48_12]